MKIFHLPLSRMTLSIFTQAQGILSRTRYMSVLFLRPGQFEYVPFITTSVPLNFIHTRTGILKCFISEFEFIYWQKW